jgi:hypothetical protein
MNIVIEPNTRIIIKANPHTLGATVAPKWIGKQATLLKWEADNWYTVECDGVKLLLSGEEFEIIK